MLLIAVLRDGLARRAIKPVTVTAAALFLSRNAVASTG
jgi:hypothetical protein